MFYTVSFISKIHINTEIPHQCLVILLNMNKFAIQKQKLVHVYKDDPPKCHKMQMMVRGFDNIVNRLT